MICGQGIKVPGRKAESGALEKTSEQVKLLGKGQPLSAQMLNHEPLYVFPVLLSGIVSFPVSQGRNL